MMNPFTPLKPFVLSFAICSLLCAALVAQQRTTPNAQSLPDTHSPSVECFRPLTTDISGDRVTTEILNACHDNAISIRFQLMSDSLPKPVEMLGDFTVSMAIASMPETTRKGNADTGYWLVGETRKLTLHYPGSPTPSTDRLGDQIVVTAALFQAGAYAGDPHALDTIKARWIEFQSEVAKVLELFETPKVRNETSSLQKLVRIREQGLEAGHSTAERPLSVRFARSDEGGFAFPIIGTFATLAAFPHQNEDQSEKVLRFIRTIAEQQDQEYRRLIEIFEVSQAKGSEVTK